MWINIGNQDKHSHKVGYQLNNLTRIPPARSHERVVLAVSNKKERLTGYMILLP